MTGRLRIKRLKFLPRVEPGYRRVYEQCRVCERVFFRDFVPFSLSNPILVAPCGDSIGLRWSDAVRRLDEATALPLMLEQRIAYVANEPRP